MTARWCRDNSDSDSEGNREGNRKTMTEKVRVRVATIDMAECRMTPTTMMCTSAIQLHTNNIMYPTITTTHMCTGGFS